MLFQVQSNLSLLMLPIFIERINVCEKKRFLPLLLQLTNNFFFVISLNLSQLSTNAKLPTKAMVSFPQSWLGDPSISKMAESFKLRVCRN